MKIDVRLPGITPVQGQTVRAEVMASGDSGSMVVVNGVPVTTDKKLSLGQRLSGKIEQVENGTATISLEQETGLGADAVSSEGWLSSQKLPTDSANKALVDMFRRMGIPLSPELLTKAKELVGELKSGLQKNDLDALGLMLLRNLPKSLFRLVKEYLAGNKNLGELLKKLPPEVLQQLRSEWSEGRLFDLLSGNPPGQEQLRQLKESFPGNLTNELSENLSFQELLSTQPQEQSDGRLYFQWPMFWHGSNVPDTLEGEAFYSPQENNEENRGFSLRLLANPPRLGPLEIGIHRFKDNIWVHFGASSEASQEALKELIPDLSVSLENLGWKKVKLTIGPKPQRDTFLSPHQPEPSPSIPVLPHLDLKV